jgi:hypothetical protein
LMARQGVLQPMKEWMREGARQGSPVNRWGESWLPCSEMRVDQTPTGATCRT